MKQVWPTKRLGDLFAFKNGRAFKKEEWTTKGLPIIRIQNLNNEDAPFNYFAGEYSQDILVESGDLLFSWSGTVGSSFGSHLWKGETGVLNQHIFKIGLHEAITKRYAFHGLRYITEEIEQSVNGAVGLVHITKEKLNEFKLPVPPLGEQQRIVSLLDEAFAGLATAKANAEKNLQNARALFESHLQSVFTQRGKGWMDRQLASLCHEITVGHVGPMKTQYKESGIPFLRSQNVRPFEVSMGSAMFIDEAFHRSLKKSQLRPGDLAIVRTGYPGTAAVIPPELPNSNCSDLVIVRPSKEVSPHFLAAFFNSAFGKQLVLGKIVGAAQKHFNITAAKEVMLHVPPLSKQLSIVAKAKALRDETQGLVNIYERKLAALDELKKALLHQAFTGELTKESPPVAVPFPMPVLGLSVLDLHAGLLGIAYQAHELAGREKTFGHVKAEKFSHLIEAVAGIDLGRMAVKDPAGPNDFPHFRTVENHAAKAGWFRFEKRPDGGYTFIKWRKFEAMVSSTRTALGGLSQKVDRLIELLLPMDTQEAEIFATVHAAWNNLLLDKETITDERIVTEARENWHQDKLRIPRPEFARMIQWIKDHDVIPQGLGKKVAARH